MTSQQLATLAHAMLGRMSRTDLMKVIRTQDDAWYAGMQLGTNSQVLAHQEACAALAEAFDNMNDHDRDLVADAVRHAAESEGQSS